MLPLFLGKLVARPIHLIHLKSVDFEDMQQILQLNMGLSVVERLKIYNAEKVVSTFLGCFNLIFSDVAKPASMDKMCKSSQFQQVSNRSGIEANRGKSSVIFRRFGSLVDVSGTVVR